MNTTNVLSKIVARLRELNTPTLMRLAQKTGVSFSTLYRLRRGLMTDPRLSVFNALRKEFRIRAG